MQEHEEELTTEELKELQVMQEISGEEEDEPKVTSTKEIKEVLAKWEEIAAFIEKKHPEKVATGRARAPFHDTCLKHFYNILKGRQIQTSLDRFFFKRPLESESVVSPTKRAKEN